MDGLAWGAELAAGCLGEIEWNGDTFAKGPSFGFGDLTVADRRLAGVPAGSRRPSCAGRARRARRSRPCVRRAGPSSRWRAAAPRGAAQAHGGEVVDREVAHGVVECQLLPGANRLAGDEVVGLPVVEADTAVRVAGVVDHRSQATVERPATGTHLRRVRVVARPRPDQEADHDGLADRERARGPNPIALAVDGAAQLDALVLGNLCAARLVLREDRRSVVTLRHGRRVAGRIDDSRGESRPR